MNTTEVKHIIVRHNGVDYNLNLLKYSDGNVELRGDMWLAPIPKELSSCDLAFAKKTFLKLWNEEYNAIDMDLCCVQD